jgi:DNA-binding transcriptional regulator/RsmH inhibitor MraZ
MPPAQFRAVGERLAENPEIAPRDRAVFLRHFYSRSVQVITDKQGRLTLPEEVGKKLGLDGEAVLVGAHQNFEIWNTKAWAATQQAESTVFDRVADLVGL